MKYLLGHQTALEYWRLHDRGGHRAALRSGARFDDPPSSTCAEGCTALARLPLPLCYVVTDPRAQRTTSAVTCRVTTMKLPAQTALSLGSDHYVGTPEACFLQMASCSDVVELARIGCELCGTYALVDGRYRFDRFPRSSGKALARYVESAGSVHGAKRARQTLRFICDGSASPMETALVLLLCLPVRYGGYGLPFPQLNYPITVGKRRYVCDLYWPESRYALEYDSTQFHADDERLNLDSARRSHLESAGIHVVSATRRQVYRVEAFDVLAQAVASALGVRLRSRARDVASRRAKLRQQLLGS